MENKIITVRLIGRQQGKGIPVDGLKDNFENHEFIVWENDIYQRQTYHDVPKFYSMIPCLKIMEVDLRKPAQPLPDVEPNYESFEDEAFAAVPEVGGIYDGKD